MQDGRLRLVSVICLSIAAFLSTAAAVLTVVWWLASESHPLQAGLSRGFLVYSSIILVVAIVIQAGGGDGATYGIRMLALGLIAVWVVRDYHSGELLDSTVWMFGSGAGYDAGLVAEMSMQGVTVLNESMDRIRTALSLKNQRWGWQSAYPVLTLLLDMMLSRADDQARLLAVRGYRRGGSRCPTFITPKADILATLGTLAILLLGVWIR